MTSRQELEELLNKVNAENQSLEVIWDTGGDQTLVNFFIEGDTKVFNPMSETLRKSMVLSMVNLLNLPNAGEYYNEGQGKFTLKDGQLFLEFDEYAYNYNYEDDDSFSYDKAILIPHNFDIPEDFQEEFYGYIASTRLFSTHFHLLAELTDQSKSRFQSIIEQSVLEQLELVSKENAEFSYEGRINNTTIEITEISKLGYTVDKHNKKVKLVFELP